MSKKTEIKGEYFQRDIQFSVEGDQSFIEQGDVVIVAENQVLPLVNCLVPETKLVKDVGKFIKKSIEHIFDGMDESCCTCGAETCSDFSYEDAGCYYCELKEMVK